MRPKSHTNSIFWQDNLSKKQILDIKMLKSDLKTQKTRFETQKTRFTGTSHRSERVLMSGMINFQAYSMFV